VNQLVPKRQRTRLNTQAYRARRLLVFAFLSLEPKTRTSERIGMCGGLMKVRTGVSVK